MSRFVINRFYRVIKEHEAFEMGAILHGEAPSDDKYPSKRTYVPLSEAFYKTPEQEGYEEPAEVVETHFKNFERVYGTTHSLLGPYITDREEAVRILLGTSTK